MPSCENCTADHDASYGSGRFCSSKCARAFSTKARRTEINQRVSAKLKGRIPANLFQLGHRFFGRPKTEASLPPRKFGSTEYRKNMSEVISQRRALSLREFADNWIVGNVDFVLTPKGRNLAFLKRVLILLRGNRCEKCGWCEVNPTTGKVPIQLHHEDGDHANNTPSNVNLLCPNCHSLTPNYMALNKGGNCPGKRY